MPGYLYYNATVTRSDHMTCLQADDPSWKSLRFRMLLRDIVHLESPLCKQDVYPNNLALLGHSDLQQGRLGTRNIQGGSLRGLLLSLWHHQFCSSEWWLLMRICLLLHLVWECLGQDHHRPRSALCCGSTGSESICGCLLLAHVIFGNSWHKHPLGLFWNFFLLILTCHI